MEGAMLGNAVHLKNDASKLMETSIHVHQMSDKYAVVVKVAK